MLAAVSAAGLGCLSNAHGETIQLPPFDVVAPRGVTSLPPGPTTVIGATAIQSAAPTLAGDTAKLMSDVPGGAYSTGGGVSSLPVLDGLADDQLNVQADGVALISACGNHMNPPLSYVPPSSVGNLVVYSNLVPVSVGGNAIGGAILAEPPPPAFAAPGKDVVLSGNAGAFFSSNGSAFGANVSLTAAGENAAVTYNGSVVTAGNYTAGGAFKDAGPAYPATPGIVSPIPWLGGNVVGSTAYLVENQDLAVAVRQQNHLLQLDLGFQNIPYQGFPNARMDMVGNQAASANLKYNGVYGWGTLDGQLYFQNVRHEMNFGADKQFWYGGDMMSPLSPGMPMDTHAQNGGAKLTATTHPTDHDTLRLGAELQLYTYNEWWPPSPHGVLSMMGPNTFVELNDGRQNRGDAFVQWDRTWSSQWDTQIGLRSDTVFMNAGPVQGYNDMMYDASQFNGAARSRTFQNWDFTAMATYTPNANQQYRLGVSQQSAAPNLHALYSWSTNPMAMEMIGWFGDGNYYVGNLALKPAVSRTVAATADFHNDSGDLGLQIRPYLTYVSNYIDAQRCPLAVCGDADYIVQNLFATTGFVYLQFVNQNARLYGLDVSGHATLVRDTPVGDFTAKGTIAYVNGVNTTVDDNLYNIMPLNANISLEQNFHGWTNTLGMQFVAAKTSISQVRNEVPTPGYSLFNFKSAYQWKNFHFEVGVTNLFNRLYYLPLGGAYVGQGATMAQANPWGVPVPGMGRSVYVATSVKF